MVLINIGVHKLESYKNSEGLFENSYFIHRPYLNYLIFSPHSAEIFYDYFNSKGGVGKQIFTNKRQLGFGPGKIWNKYGASVLMTNPDEKVSNKEYKTEYFGIDFTDKDIIYPWKSPEDLHWIILTQRGKKFLVTDEHLILDNDVWTPNPKFQFSDKKVKDIKDILDHDFDYLLPRLHSGEFFLQKTPKNQMQVNIKTFLSKIAPVR